MTTSEAEGTPSPATPAPSLRETCLRVMHFNGDEAVSEFACAAILALLTELDDYRSALREAQEDAKRFAFYADQRAEVHQRPYTLTVHVNSFVSLREHTDSQMAYAARAAAGSTTP